jgi:hypothetical protein
VGDWRADRPLAALESHTMADLAAADPGMLAGRFGPVSGPLLVLDRFTVIRPVRLFAVRVEFPRSSADE